MFRAWLISGFTKTEFATVTKKLLVYEFNKVLPKCPECHDSGITLNSNYT